MCKFPHDNSGMPVTFLHHPLNFAYFRFIFMSFKTQYLNFLSVLSENLTFPDPHHPASAQKLYKPPAVLLPLLPFIAGFRAVLGRTVFQNICRRLIIQRI